jgi:hypothetical protein
MDKIKTSAGILVLLTSGDVLKIPTVREYGTINDSYFFEKDNRQRGYFTKDKVIYFGRDIEIALEGGAV